MEHRHICVDCETAWFCYEQDCGRIEPSLCAECVEIRLSGSSATPRDVLLDRTSPVLGQLFESRKEELLRFLKRRGQTGGDAGM